jgi:hypothetical protein
VPEREAYAVRMHALGQNTVTNAVSAAAVAAIAFAAGCAEKRVEMWTPKPTVQWENITTRQVEPPIGDEYRVLTGEPTHGLFPASISVTRVAIGTGDEATVPGVPYLLNDPRNEALQWNSAFDDQMAISEVFPIAKRDLGGADAEPEQILAAMHALGARIGLIYAVNEVSEMETQMIGALYETATARPLASFHAQAVSTVPLDEKREPDPDDLWETDSKALVRDKFERIVHRCVRRLIADDQPAEIETPDGWTPAGPLRPTQWPPRPYVIRRQR